MTNLRMPGETCSIFSSYGSRAAPGISFFRRATKIDDKIKLNGDLKRQIKKQTLHISKLFLLTKLFQYTSNWSKASRTFTHHLIQYT